MTTTTAQAHPNIAFIKYWGNRDETLRLPANGSISMNLAGLETRTTVAFSNALEEDTLRAPNKTAPAAVLGGGDAAESGVLLDTLSLNGRAITGPGLQRVSAFLELVRKLAGVHLGAVVTSENNFPTGAGIASSAAAFAALALAATHAAGLNLGEADLSRLARLGSGSACRSIPGGFVEWQVGTGDADSYAISIAPPEHWSLADCIAVLSSEAKLTGSTEGHARANTSPLQTGRVADAPRRLEICRNAILHRDFEALAEIVELDSDMMHAVMMTSRPPLFYWQPATLAVMEAIRTARGKGLPVCYTIDAGPNVHVITEAAEAEQVVNMLKSIPEVREVLAARVGGPARLA